MNFGVGFFRIWIVASVLFATGVAVLSYDKIASEFERAGQDWSKAGILLVPVDCRDARGKVNVDYTPPEGPWNAYTGSPQCWYRADVLRRLYPEYKDLPDDDLSDRLYKKGWHCHQPRKAVAEGLDGRGDSRWHSSSCVGRGRRLGMGAVWVLCAQAEGLTAKAAPLETASSDISSPVRLCMT